ncbi:sugar ABC transporter ATP-binding protein [Rhodospirillum rubrum]|uniref:sugar ABC transporter ATP-binding protein n=1 Tax=Rhodospirillum rubrum TaxID=1085 RepID=UPI001903ABDD|nr:sugar ABC transporter ATP-binding protein [Rhodospirillum rubrum]MBK1662972.1 sugar ABC transporter ATP-binding protein [Rhodospirillum rubrum]MBK1675259.1 sugar ABC transporter ATP-binding protein [Rhodospirillum rubrum]
MATTAPVLIRDSAPREATSPPFLDIRDVHKRFAGVKALRGVSLAIERGQIYHLLGENGCGKSTLIKIISGAQPPDEGTLVIEGREVAGLSPIMALAAGIETVYQDLSLLPNLSVAENIALSQQLVASGGQLARRLDLARLKATATRALEAVTLPAGDGFLATRVDELPIATRQLIAIARVIATDAKLVIMDEPTTALTKREVDNLIEVVEKLRAKGVAVLFVTHKLDECRTIGGRAIILRDGRKVMEGDIADFTKKDLSHWMTGRVLDDSRYRQAERGGERLLDVRDLGRANAFGGVSFSLNRGEILGVTGLLDSGRNELALALAGVCPADRGGVSLAGERVVLSQPADAIAAGIGYLPEDRLSEGLFLEKPIADNIIASVLDRLRGRLGMLDRPLSRSRAQEMTDDLQIATPDIANPVQSLSGGNQQRVLIGRWLMIEPRLLVLHGPTVGVDVGSKDTIFRIIQRLAKGGMGVIIISDDLPELLQNCDRILVMRKGRVAEIFDAEGLGEGALYRALVAEESPRSLP